MGRNKHYRNRGGFEADREKRGGRLLKVFRRVERDDAQLIGGALTELAHSGDIPPLKTSMGYQTFLFDPRLMEKNVNQAIIVGFKFAQLVAKIERNDAFIGGGYDVGISGVRLLEKNRRTLLATIESEEVEQERSGLYQLLGEQGIRGFSLDGRRSGRRDSTPFMAIGNFSQPIARADETKVLEIVETGLAMQLSPFESPRVDLGELEIRSYQPG